MRNKNINIGEDLTKLAGEYIDSITLANELESAGYETKIINLTSSMMLSIDEVKAKKGDKRYNIVVEEREGGAMVEDVKPA